MPIALILLFAFAGHLALLSLFVWILEFDAFGVFSIQDDMLLQRCLLVGAIGGGVYCMRAIYLNYCVRGTWENKWLVWHVIRPFVSFICGGISLIFLKAGLIVLEAQPNAISSDYAYYALAFLAGYNVDNFLKKIEEISKSVLGIDTSRASNKDCCPKDKRDNND